MRFVLLIAGVLLLAGCQRDYREGHPATTATASSVWDYLEIDQLAQVPDGGGEQEQQADEGIEPSIELGPAFSELDTVDTELLPGVWLQVFQSVGERISPLPLDNMDVLEIAPNGQLAWHFITDGQDNLQTGLWEKSSPGNVTFNLGDRQAMDVRLQMFGEDFFFFWSYAASVGWWFARIPENPAPRIMYDNFTTNLGDIHFDSVNDNIFQGTASGDYQRIVAGVYTNGVLLMRWEEPDTTAAGYAAFVVAPDWSELDGVWWIDDYQAAPFGGPYTATPTAQGALAPP